MPLHLDYRPRNFKEIIGNQTTIETIQNKIQGEDPPHAILLYGPRGCGKTTIARIISNELGCDLKSMDFIELDAVQCGRIETAREIRESMHFSPTESKCRVWLIDEAHGSSTKFQEGLLKALEDTPKHVYFILCTTELNKIITTVKSRCMKFQVNLLDAEQIEHLLVWVLKEEKFEMATEIIDEIISAADGCPREALVILDQIIDLEPDKMIGAIQQTEAEREVKELCQAMLRSDDWNKLRKILKRLGNLEPERARQAIIKYMQVVALNDTMDTAGRPAFVFDCFRENVYTNGMAGIVFASYNTTL